MGITFSKPKKLPYSKPNIIDTIPELPITKNRSDFFLMYIKNPTKVRTNPCPKSPNIMPKKTMNIIATNGVGSISSLDGRPNILTINSKCLKNPIFFNNVGAFNSGL